MNCLGIFNELKKREKIKTEDKLIVVSDSNPSTVNNEKYNIQ